MSTSSSDTRKIFIANFRVLLTAADWTQTEAAQQLGISQGSVSDFASGKRFPSLKGIESIAYRLGVPADIFTSRPISLEHMRKLLVGKRPPRVAEAAAAYRANRQPEIPSLRKLKLRWKKKPEGRDQIRVALRVLFRDQTDEIITWLDTK